MNTNGLFFMSNTVELATLENFEKKKVCICTSVDVPFKAPEYKWTPL